MNEANEISAVEQALDNVLQILLHETGAGRCTLRIDDPMRDWHVDFICAEALGTGVKSLRGDGSINQRAAATVKWLAAEKRHLLQPDLTGSPVPAPPPALMSAYAAKAQMLAPLLASNCHLAGWISVHYIASTHAITAEDERALQKATSEVLRLTGIGR